MLLLPAQARSSPSPGFIFIASHYADIRAHFLLLFRLLWKLFVYNVNMLGIEKYQCSHCWWLWPSCVVSSEIVERQTRDLMKRDFATAVIKVGRDMRIWQRMSCNFLLSTGFKIGTSYMCKYQRWIQLKPAGTDACQKIHHLRENGWSVLWGWSVLFVTVSGSKLFAEAGIPWEQNYKWLWSNVELWPQ